jgi:hypothetical protein
MPSALLKGACRPSIAATAGAAQRVCSGLVEGATGIHGFFALQNRNSEDLWCKNHSSQQQLKNRLNPRYLLKMGRLQQS